MPIFPNRMGTPGPRSYSVWGAPYAWAGASFQLPSPAVKGCRCVRFFRSEGPYFSLPSDWPQSQHQFWICNRVASTPSERCAPCQPRALSVADWIEDIPAWRLSLRLIRAESPTTTGTASQTARPHVKLWLPQKVRIQPRLAETQRLTGVLGGRSKTTMFCHSLAKTI